MSLHRKKKPEVSPEGVDNFNEQMKKRTRPEGYVKSKRLLEQQKAFDTKVSEMKAQLDIVGTQLNSLSERIDKLITTDKAVHTEAPAPEPEPKPEGNE